MEALAIAAGVRVPQLMSIAGDDVRTDLVQVRSAAQTLLQWIQKGVKLPCH
jgi:hypothetical protein